MSEPIPSISRAARTRTSRGFSMAEVLVATALLSVILLALFGLVTAGIHRAYGGKKMTEATVIAQAVMERANVAAPQLLLDADPADSTAEIEWTKDALGTAESSVTPALESGTTIPVTERNAWRNLLLNSELPASATNPITLTVTMTAVPTATATTAARTFANAAAVQIIVDVTWTERGTRERRVRLQTLNVRAVNI